MTTPDPNGMTVAEIREYVAYEDDDATLRHMLAEESDGKDRKTAKSAIEERLDEVDEDAEHEDEQDGSDAEDESSHIRVRPSPNVGGGHIAGYSFEPGEIKLLPAEAKVKKALMRGKLQRVA